MGEHAFLRPRSLPRQLPETGPARKVPRVRFEAIVVGVGLALRQRQNLDTAHIGEWLSSPEFKAPHELRHSGR